MPASGIRTCSGDIATPPTVNGSTAKSGIVVDLAAGTLSGGGTGGAGSATVANMESVVGTQFADHITGNAAANYVFAWIGDDTIEGGAGVDTLGGGAGNDHFVFHETGGTAIQFWRGMLVSAVASCARMWLGLHAGRLMQRVRR